MTSLIRNLARGTCCTWQQLQHEVNGINITLFCKTHKGLYCLSSDASEQGKKTCYNIRKYILEQSIVNTQNFPEPFPRRAQKGDCWNLHIKKRQEKNLYLNFCKDSDSMYRNPKARVINLPDGDSRRGLIKLDLLCWVFCYCPRLCQRCTDIFLKMTTASWSLGSLQQCLHVLG